MAKCCSHSDLARPFTRVEYTHTHTYIQYFQFPDIHATSILQRRNDKFPTWDSISTSLSAFSIAANEYFINGKSVLPPFDSICLRNFSISLH
jgi:hypothetical protein